MKIYSNLMSIALGVLFCASLGSPARAAQAPASAAPGKGPANVVTLQQMVEPAFRVQPVVQRFTGRRGEVVHFSFLVESTGKDVNCEVKPVALRQEMAGAILHNEATPPPVAIKLSTPGRFKVTAGESVTIAGELRIPHSKSKFHSFGIVVRDLGQQTNFSSAVDAQGKPQTRAGVRFITQYVLRCDLEVTDAPGDDVKSLRMVETRVISSSGWPLAVASIENPTDSTFELQIRGKFEGDGAGDGKSFLLGQPSRASMGEPDRFIVRLLPKATIQVEAPVSSVLRTGQHNLRLQMSGGRDGSATSIVPISVAGGSFPAQDVEVRQVGEVLAISPAQIEIGQTKGGKRSLSLLVQNLTDKPQQLRLAPESLSGEKLPGLQVAAGDVTVPPGKQRKIPLMVHSQKDLNQAVYGYVHVTTTGEDGTSSATKLPIAMLYGPREKPNLAFTELALRTGPGDNAFFFSATNAGAGFVPVRATLAIVNEENRTMRLLAGYGRWLNPGESSQLEFGLNEPLAPGEYELTMTVETHEGLEPLTKTTVIRVPVPNQQASPAIKPGPEKQNAKRVRKDVAA